MMTMSNIAPTTMPAMAPPERPLLLVGDTTTGATGARDVVLVVLGPGTTGVDPLVVGDGLTVTYVTGAFEAIIVDVAAKGEPPKVVPDPKSSWSYTLMVRLEYKSQSHAVTSSATVKML